MNSIHLGKLGEQIALQRLLSSGYRLVEKNFRTSFGELDLVMEKGGILVFVEVKTVCSSLSYTPVENITVRKLNHLKNAISTYLSLKKEPPVRVYRLDFVGLVLDAKHQLVAFDHRQSIG